MSPLLLLLVQISFSFVALGVLVTRVQGWARRFSSVQVLEWLLWLHVPRSVPLGLLAPGQVSGVPAEVASTIAWGDFTSAALALMAIVALRTSSERAAPWLWAFTVISCLDIVTALVLGLGSGVYQHALGVSWFVLTLYVPIVCVSQAAFVKVLLELGRSPVEGTLKERHS